MQVQFKTVYASQGFVKQMLDVADNLERAAGAVPSAALGGGQEVDAAEVQKQLRTLLEGVKMTQQVLNQVASAQQSGHGLTGQAHHSAGVHTSQVEVCCHRLSDSTAWSRFVQREKALIRISTKHCFSSRTPVKSLGLSASSPRCRGSIGAC